MLVVTTENLPGYRVLAVRGHVFGVAVRSRGVGGNVVASFRSIFGGEIREYTEMLEEGRRLAVERMILNAKAIGANAIVMMRLDSSEIGGSMNEFLAYGTAMLVERVLR